MKKGALNKYRRKKSKEKLQNLYFIRAEAVSNTNFLK
jgi:hypothetical protein